MKDDYLLLDFMKNSYQSTSVFILIIISGHFKLNKNVRLSELKIIT